ncbi:MAG: diguanylate cyclase [Lachnospiraceae bacterium]|nr:diguanylate cyclase [Lachnospiraceae bacterium]
MINRQSSNKRIVPAIFAAAALIMIIVIRSVTGDNDVQGSAGVTPIPDGWRDQAGNICTIDDAHTNSDGIPVVLEKKIMQGFADTDCLCFASYNVNLKVYVDDKEIYSYESVDNLTGKGYGTAFHEVDLPVNLGGRILRIEFESSDPASGNEYGYIANVYLGSAMSYIHMLFDRKAISVGISVFIVFLGLMFVLISMAVDKSERIPFDITSLGIAAILLGLWLLIATDIIQLLTGHVYVVRVLNRILIMLVGYPLVRFFNSLTNKRRLIYPLIQLVCTAILLVILIALRYYGAVDMMTSFPKVLIIYCVVLAVTCILMFADDELYCRDNGMMSRLKRYYIGLAVFLFCVFADFTLYMMRRIVGNDTYGVVTRAGSLILIVVILRQFMRWWTRDRAVIERGHLISSSLSIATSDNTPDNCIKQILECAAKQFGAGRAVVFEDQKNGKFHGTYAWFEHRDEIHPSGLLLLPQKGLVDEIIKACDGNGGRLTVDDTENYKMVNTAIYNMLRSQNVKNIIIGPITTAGNVTGLVTLVDIPTEMMEEASENISLIAYFLSELIANRDEDKRTRFFEYNDPLSGALNRRAFNELSADLVARATPFGFVLVEIRDLETVSSQKGYEAGDRLVTDTVTLMSEIFGNERVYRLVGSRFAAFGFETDEAYFEDESERLIEEANKRNISLNVGFAFCNNGTKDMNTVVKYAEAHMH